MKWWLVHIPEGSAEDELCVSAASVDDNNQWSKYDFGMSDMENHLETFHAVGLHDLVSNKADL